MERFSYTLTLEDCKDYAISQYKIPRLKNFILKMYIPFWIIGLLAVLVFIFPIFLNFFTGLSYLMKEGGMTFFRALVDFQMLEFYKSSLIYFISAVLPLIVIWLVIFAIGWGFGATDAFSLTSKRIFKMLSGKALDAEVEVQENGLYMEGKGISSFVGWDGIVEIYSATNTFLLFVSDYQAVIIPKRAFKTPELAQEFFELVDSKVKASKN